LGEREWGLGRRSNLEFSVPSLQSLANCRIVHDPTVPQEPRLETDVRVMFFDTDAGGVVHNLAYLRFIEINRSLLAEKLGWKFGSLIDQQQCPVVVRTEIDYRRPARLWDELKVVGWLDKFSRSRFWCAFEVSRPSDATVLVTCRQMLAVVQLPELKVLRLPGDWTLKYPGLASA
jgi:YbgC/YbaW family acyl-CoA thioester hydrolase